MGFFNESYMKELRQYFSNAAEKLRVAVLERLNEQHNSGEVEDFTIRYDRVANNDKPLDGSSSKVGLLMKISVGKSGKIQGIVFLNPGMEGITTDRMLTGCVHCGTIEDMIAYLENPKIALWIGRYWAEDYEKIILEDW